MEEFEALYNEMLPAIYRYTTARLGTSAGEDVTADVFHAAASAVRAGNGDSITPAWLMAVAKNKVIDQWRKTERRSRVAHLVTPRARDTFVASAEDEASFRSSEVMATLDNLPTRYRTLLMLRYVDDLSVAELARQTGLSESATESALARARKAFRTAFEGASL